MSKKKYELSVELKDIPTDDLVKMVRDCWYIGEIDILCLLVFHDNDADSLIVTTKNLTMCC